MPRVRPAHSRMRDAAREDPGEAAESDEDDAHGMLDRSEFTALGR